MQVDDCRNIREIDSLHDDIDAVLLAQLLGESFKSVQPARDQNQRMALRRVLAGELRAEAARCAGDENPRVVCSRHGVYPVLSHEWINVGTALHPGSRWGRRRLE